MRIMYCFQTPLHPDLILQYYIWCLNWYFNLWWHCLFETNQLNDPFLWRGRPLLNIALRRHDYVYGWLTNNHPGRGMFWIFDRTYTCAWYHLRHIYHNIIHEIFWFPVLFDFSILSNYFVLPQLLVYL